MAENNWGRHRTSTFDFHTCIHTYVPNVHVHTYNTCNSGHEEELSLDQRKKLLFLIFNGLLGT